VIRPATLLAAAALLVALALQISSGMFDLRALALVTLATSAAIAAALWSRFRAPPVSGAWVQALLGGGVAIGLACHLFVNPTFYADVRALQGGFRWFAAIALVVLSAYLCIHLRASLIRARFLLLLLCFAVMGIVVIRASPRPWIDVWVFQQDAAKALLHGLNPYTIPYPEIYGSQSQAFHARELLRGGVISAFPYPPLTFLAGAPAFAAFGDIRYALLALMIAGAWLLARALPGNAGELAAALALFQPRGLFVLEQSWTEPLVFFCFALTAYAIARRAHWALAGAALGLLVASKQYAFMLAIPLAFALPRRRALWVTLAVLLLCTVPFALPDPSAFWRGVVRFHFLQPFRIDSLSLTALAARLSGGPIGLFAYAGIAVAALVLALTVRRHTGLPLACASAGAAFAAMLIWNQQSFCNYWWLCSIFVAAAASVAPASQPAVQAQKRAEPLASAAGAG